jgi:hypothetical protein
MPTPRLPLQLLRPLNPLPTHILNHPPQLLLHKLHHFAPPLIKPQILVRGSSFSPHNTSIPRTRNPQNLLLRLKPNSFGQSAHVSAQSAIRRRHFLVHERAFEGACFGCLGEAEVVLGGVGVGVGIGSGLATARRRLLLRQPSGVLVALAVVLFLLGSRLPRFLRFRRIRRPESRSRQVVRAAGDCDESALVQVGE